MTHTDTQAFLDMAQAAVDALPEPFRAGAQDVVLRVQDMPDAALLHDMQIDNPMNLTGLYSGIPMTHKSATYPSPYPDTVTLFRKPILAEWRARGDVELSDLVTHVTVHEFAHHFGWSDDDIASIDRWWE
ncbi:metallopeptidase family protein [Primorskyibacter sp. 2E233]|uniref:metallopeptidase family protein n=1 Tax=Primorskyibacter sp. 2E233 TaxID=3413431 RepID=UPI003BF2341D